MLPALATTGGMLVGISSPYRKVGLLHQKHRDHFGKPDADVLVIQAATRVLNPTIDNRIIDRARKSDPESALAEWDGMFRADIAQLLDDKLIDEAIEYGRPLELSPQRKHSYVAFVDASAGRHDAFTIGIGHHEEGAFVADVVRGTRAPFDPATVAGEYAKLALEYGCAGVTGDNFSGEWVAAAFRNAGVTYTRATMAKSQLYLEALPWFARGAVRIPDHPKLIRELRLLERRTSRSGRDSVDHPQNGSDDYANALVGAMQMSARPRAVTTTTALRGLI